MTKHIHIHLHDAEEERGKLRTRSNMANHRFWAVAGVKGKGPHKQAAMARAERVERRSVEGHRRRLAEEMD